MLWRYSRGGHEGPDSSDKVGLSRIVFAADCCIKGREFEVDVNQSPVVLKVQAGEFHTEDWYSVLGSCSGLECGTKI
jgi:hypothetical protein